LGLLRVVPDGTTKISYQPKEKVSIQKVEIVKPAGDPKQAGASIVRWLFSWNLRTLVVFWFVATWFPEWGLTYWALLLPVYIASWLFHTSDARFIPEKYLFRQRYDHGHGMVEEEITESTTKLDEVAKK
jgi:hypothetical protein